MLEHIQLICMGCGRVTGVTQEVCEEDNYRKEAQFVSEVHPETIIPDCPCGCRAGFKGPFAHYRQTKNNKVIITS